MTTSQLDLTILSAPVASIDRRALSQAWYSALHLARRGSAGGSERARAGAAGDASSLAPAASDRASRAASRAVQPAPVPRGRAAARRSGGIPMAERRAPRLPLARQIERTFFESRSPVRRSTFTVGDGAARVVVVLQQRGARLALVAICPPHVRSTVARALEQARFALAARGIAVEAVVSGEPACS